MKSLVVLQLFGWAALVVALLIAPLLVLPQAQELAREAVPQAAAGQLEVAGRLLPAAG